MNKRYEKESGFIVRYNTFRSQTTENIRRSDQQREEPPKANVRSGLVQNNRTRTYVKPLSGIQPLFLYLDYGE